MSARTVQVLRIPLPHTPATCPHCSKRATEWPLGVCGGRLSLVCPNCHVPAAALVAVTDTHEH